MTEVIVNGVKTDRFFVVRNKVVLTDFIHPFPKGGIFWKFIRAIPFPSKYGYTNFATVQILYEYGNE